jgi:hypothetical protein
LWEYRKDLFPQIRKLFLGYQARRKIKPSNKLG